MTSFSKHSFIEIQPESLVCIFCIITIELSIQDKVCIVSKIKIFVTWSFTEKKKLQNYHLENFLQINNEEKKRIIIKI